MTAADDDPVQHFAREKLGPVSAAFVADDAVRTAVDADREAGLDLEDAVLKQLHGALGNDPLMADEFAAYFMLDLMRMGRLSMSASSRLRRFLDTGDLVASVFGDLWGDLTSLRFRSRHQFKTLFAQRMQWKAVDKARRLSTQRRREDRRVPHQPEELDDLGAATDSAHSPLSESILQEEKEQLILILLRLKERDRRLLTLHLKGDSIDAIAAQLGMSYDAARKALSRALAQAQELAAADERNRK